MPTYQYRCPECAELYEERRTFARADEPSRCPACGGDRSRKVIGTAMFFAPGSAAKAMLAPGASCASPSCANEDPHGFSCPCCS